MSVFNELCFSLKPFEVYINEDVLIDDFMDFAVSKKVSICGNLDVGFCFCTEKKELPYQLKQNFISFLCEQYFDRIETVFFEIYNESEEEFKIIE